MIYTAVPMWYSVHLAQSRAACLEIGEMIKFSNAVPGKFRDPGRPWVRRLLGAVKHLTPLQEELPLLCVHLGGRLQNAHAHLQ